MGRPIGNPRWAAPEQAAGGTEVNGYADVFAWGHLVRFAATGWEPSGTAVAEPDLGDVPEFLAPLVREALREDPGERPTASHLLEELTGRSEDDPGTAVSGILAETWTGVTVPEPRPAGRSRVSVLMGATAGVLATALLAAWLVGDPAEDTDDAVAGRSADSADSTSADEADAEGSEETRDGGEDEPTGPTVAETPEDVETVAAEAVELALEAPGFATYEHDYVHGLDSAPRIHLSTQTPVPAMSRASYLSPRGSGIVVSGALAENYASFAHFPPEDEGGERREYYREPEIEDGRIPDLRSEWEELLDLVRASSEEEADLTFQGTSSVPYEYDYLTEEMVGEEDPAERSGLHYSGTTVFDIRAQGPEPVEYDLWIAEAGYPLYVRVRQVLDEISEFTGEPITTTHMVDFASFGDDIVVELPSEDQIAPELPWF